MAYVNPIADESIEVLRIPIPVMIADLAGNSFTLTSGGAIPVQSQAASSLSATLQNAAAATGAGTVFTVLGMSSAQFTVTGTFVGTITWQGSEDGTNYSSIFAVQLGTNTIATTATGTGTFEASVAGLQTIRANVTAYTSGSITVTAHAVPGSFSPRVTNVNLVAGSAVIGATTIQATSGTALTADQTNSILKTSLYVKTSAAADTVLALGNTTTANSLPVTLASNQGAIGNLTSAYPQGAVPITAASGDVAAATAAATLAATGGKTTYITGFSFTSTGATGVATVDITITGTITGTLTYVFATVAGATTANTPLNITFPYPIPASATNTTIVASCPTLGTGNLHAAMNAYGFQL